jgi:hypothetical protein
MGATHPPSLARARGPFLRASPSPNAGNADADWIVDHTIAPPIGQRVLHKGFVAHVRAVSISRGEPTNITIEYHQMYKTDSALSPATLRQCHIDPDGATTSHPCAAHSFALTHGSPLLFGLRPHSHLRAQPAVAGPTASSQTCPLMGSRYASQYHAQRSLAWRLECGRP